LPAPGSAARRLELQAKGQGAYSVGRIRAWPLFDSAKNTVIIPPPLRHLCAFWALARLACAQSIWQPGSGLFWGSTARGQPALWLCPGWQDQRHRCAKAWSLQLGSNLDFRISRAGLGRSIGGLGGSGPAGS
jgi:hypothetical protein